MSATSARDLSRSWSGRLAHYQSHRNDEHLQALVLEAVRYTGLHLENDLSASPYWSKAPLMRRAALLLFLVDRGIVSRVVCQGRKSFEARADASAWAAGQASPVEDLVPTLEFVAALQSDQVRRLLRSPS